MLVGNKRRAIAVVERRDQKPGGFFGLFEAVAVAAPGHAERIVQQHDQRNRAAAGEKSGAGLKNRVGEQQHEKNHRQRSERQEQPMAQAITARDAFLREQDEAHGGKLDALQPAAIQQMDQNRQRGGEKSEQKMPDREK